ncbi:YdeI/OmpD-associated family protein [Luteimonas cucumeris]|uniref:YdeI/OmpD-associated family protein n=1 Tax=Luteimonas cucumeris TaxID=985012 RepID=UPI0011A283F1|nr:YdeI/OmpD-associated family protein [Luteimonas cucumeris]
MSRKTAKAIFEALLQRPADPGPDKSWAFVVLPKDASEKLPRRGRTTVDGAINGIPFRETLEPDGQLSHWLRVSAELREAANADFGTVVTVEIAPVDQEPDPEIPADLRKALQANPEAQVTWESATTVARLDWIHWITSAKQAKTRVKRIADACEMLSAGKRRVCCFDESGFYSKAFKPPQSAN